MAETEKKDVIDETLDDEKKDDQTDDDSGKSGEEGKKNGSEDSSEKSFTQKQVSAMMAKEKKQGRAAAFKELGIDPKDTKMVSMFKAFVESQKTDDEKAAEKSKEEQAKLDEANNRALIAEAKAEAMLLGVQTEYVEDVVTLAISKIGKDEDSDIKTVIREFKTKYPDWFKAKEDDKSGDDEGKTGQKGTGSSVKNNKEKNDKGEEVGLGARLAAQRKTSNKKSSYWGSNK